MFVVLLRFSDNRSRAGELMQGHNDWIQRGFDEGVFLLTGSLQPAAGGAVIATNTTLDKLRDRVNEDPFVAEQVVEAQILEITPGRVDDRLTFLQG